MKPRSIRFVAVSALAIALLLVTHPDLVHAQIPLGSATVELDLVAEGLTAPVTATHAGDGSGRLFVVDQAGLIRIIDSGTLLATPFLDLTSEIVALDPGFDERGLLGLAFHPDYATNGRFFVRYSVERTGTMDEPCFGTSRGCHTEVLAEFTVSGDPDIANPGGTILFEVDEPQFNHNAGHVAFGPDGFLYFSLGDGGGAHDGLADNPPSHGPTGNGQNIETHLGSMLRIDVDGGSPFVVPPTNPFVGMTGLDEIYAYGFRNPYRFSFDRGDGRLIVADVGQNLIEEVDIVELGGNYGWVIREGSQCFDPFDPTNPPATCSSTGPSGEPLLDPVAEYDHGDGIAIVGGFVYRGSRYPELEGKYIFGDFSRTFSPADGRVFWLDADGTLADIFEFRLGKANQPLDRYVLGFGEDEAGEIYLLTSDNLAPTGSTGKVWHITQADVRDLRITEVDPDADQVEVTNTGVSGFTTAANRSFCHRFNYASSVPGGTSFASGEQKIFTVSNLNDLDSDLWLYEDPVFGIASNIIHGVKYGPQANVGRSGLASTTNPPLWPSGTAFAPAPPPGTTLAWDHFGFSPKDWYIDETPTMGAADSTTPGIVASSLASPGGTQDFEAMSLGDEVIAIDGWVIVNSSTQEGIFTVRSVDDVLGVRTPRNGSTRWLRIRDQDDGDVQNRFYSPAITPAVDANYAWTFFVNLEETPPGAGAVNRPRLVIQHRDAGGFANAWGIEFSDTGASLVVTGIGGVGAQTALYSLNSPTGLGDWVEIELSADFSTDTVSASANGGAPVSLPISLAGTAAKNDFRLCYRGEGADNVNCMLLDDVSVAVDLPDLQITKWESVKHHGGAVNADLSIALNATASGLNASNETRRDGVQKVVVTFDDDITGLHMPGNIVTTGGLNVTNETVSGNALTIELSGSSDGSCYTIDISNSITGLTGDADVALRSLEGDTDGGDAVVNLIDAAEVKTRNGANPADPAFTEYDIQLDGAVNLIDFAEVKGRNGTASNCP